jgi:hypothetical protein
MEKHDHKWLAHIFQKKIKATTKIIKDKAILQKFITISKGPLDERYGEHVKIELVFSYPKQNLSLDENHQQKGGDQP